MGDTHVAMGEEKDDVGLPPSRYTVGWICALPYEMKAARSMLDCEHPTLRLQSEQDGNNYLLGRIGKHNIAITSLPQAGTNRAATASKSLQTTFPNIRFCLLVGVGGGVPKSVFSWNDVRLGDIVVSEPTEQGGGVIQYDMGRRERHGFHRLGTLNKPPALLLTAKNTLSTTKNLSKAISELVNDNFGDEEDPEDEWTYPNKARDVLSNTDHPPTTKSIVLIVSFGVVFFASTTFLQFRQRNPGEEWSSLQLYLWISCVLCILFFMWIISTWYLKPKEVIRTQRQTTDPKIHYGNIGSGNSVVKNAFQRDEVAKRDNVICFEMEAAGIMDDFPCLVIRGISDYADSHKNWEWQPYAAAVAAAYAKKLLLTISPIGVENMELMREVTEGIQSIQKHTEELVRNQHSQHDDMILKWLTPVDHNIKHHDIIRQRQLGTGQWFLDSTKFKDWQTKGENKSLFCPGMPGAGKTILSAIVIDHLQKEFRDDINVGIAFLYCDFQQHHEQSAEHLLASLLKQLACQRPGSLSSLYEGHQRNKTRPSFEEMLKTLHSVAGSYKQVFIIIDAVDECQSDGIRSKLLELVLELQAETGTKILVTSRPNIETQHPFLSSDVLEIKASDHDVERYVDGNMHELPAFVGRNKDLRKRIKREIIGRVDGMFLLARLHMNSLIGQVTENDIMDELSALPTGLQAYDEAYEKCMERIEGQIGNRKMLAKKLLSWITCAERPLKLRELKHALAVKIGRPSLSKGDIPQEMVEVCAGLIKIDIESQVIRLVHYTTQEYFQREQGRWFPDAQVDMTLTCLTYLGFDSFQSGPCQTMEERKARGRSNPFYSYAARYWGRHARHTQLELETEEDIIRKFLLDSAKTAASGQFWPEHVIPHELNYDLDLTGLHLVAYFGLHFLVDVLLEAGCTLNATDSWGRTPLLLAAQEGCNSTVRRLVLERDIEINAIDIFRLTPLLYAALIGHDDVVEALLKHPNIDINTQNYDKSTPLSLAVFNRHDAVVEALLKHPSIEVNTQDRGKNTPLSLAALHGQHAVVEALLKHPSIQINARDMRERTPLYLAASDGHNDVVEALLKHPSIEINALDEWGSTPLSSAASNGQHAVVEALLKRPNIDVNTQIRNNNDNTWKWGGRTVLELAVEYGHKEVVGLLASFDKMEINRIDDEGQTALMLAVTKKNVSVIEELLDHQATWAAQDLDGRTALHLAVFGGYEEGVSSLVSKKYRGNLEIRDAYGFTALHLASRATEWLGETGVRIVKLLIKEGADDKTRTCLRMTPGEIEESVRRNSAARLQLLQTDPKHRSIPGITYEDDQERMSMLIEVKMYTWKVLFGRTGSRDMDSLNSIMYDLLSMGIKTDSGGLILSRFPKVLPSPGPIWSKLLSEGLCQCLDEYFRHILVMAKNHTGKDLLRFYSERWNLFLISSGTIEFCYRYLEDFSEQDRILYCNDLSTPFRLCFEYWRDCFFCLIKENVARAWEEMRQNGEGFDIENLERIGKKQISEDFRELRLVDIITT